MSEAPSTSWAIWAWQAYKDGRLVDAPAPPAVQPDAAAIREAALREVLEACAAEVDQMRKIWRGANNANKMRRELETDGAFEILAVLAGMISIEKEVMPSERPVRDRQADIGPGNRLIAGAALEVADSWLTRWAAHVGPCIGGAACTCGLSRVRFDVASALETRAALAA
jgi:hypothetical protein